MVAPHFSLADAKAAMRRDALARRTAGDASVGADLAAHVLADTAPPPRAIVAGFWPIGSEIDIRPLLQALHARGHVLVLPVTPPRGQRLRFRRWRPGDALAAGPLGTRHPAAGDMLEPDWLLVPLLAFDRAGRRLGYGGGYYDRTLAALPGAFAVGCAYAAQEVPDVPAGPADATLTTVATEQGVLRLTA